MPDAGSIFGQVFVVADGEFHVDDGIRIAMFVFFVEGQVWAFASYEHQSFHCHRGMVPIK